MLFSSIVFIYYFLPIVLIIYFAVPFRCKNTILFISGMLFYAWGEPHYVVWMLASITCAYFFGLAIEKHREDAAGKWLTVSSVAITLSFLLYFKYTDFLLENLNTIFSWNIRLPGITLPIGISFYTFQIISYTVDVKRGRVAALKSFINFGAYAVMFPQLVAGPIVRCSDVADQLKARTHSMEKAAGGVRRFVTGLAKKVLIANVLGELVTRSESGSTSVLFCWIGAVAGMLQVYYDFSGYSDMAIGLGNILGFTFPENFNYPLISGSIREFWRRWHISLGTWFRDYVYIPMGGSRVSTPRYIINVFTVWLLTGLWHGAQWNFVIWGLSFGILITAEKYLQFDWLLAAVRKIAVLFVLTISFTIFNANGISDVCLKLSQLFGLKDLSLSNNVTAYYFRSYFVVLLIAVAGATPFPTEAYRRFEATDVGRMLLTWLEPIALTVLLLICTAYLVDGSYNPFLYFRF